MESPQASIDTLVDASRDTPGGKRQDAADGDTPAPPAKRPRRGPRVKAAEDAAEKAHWAQEEAQKLASVADQASQAAARAEAEAARLSKVAADARAAADAARTGAEEAARKAEQAEQATTAEGRAAMKQKDKEGKQAAKEAAKEMAVRAKEEATINREMIRRMGDEIKSCLRIVKVGGRGGFWHVPPGRVAFKNVEFFTFEALFAGCTITPSNYSSSTAAISVSTRDPGSVFGVTKIRGGSMYAKFQISKMDATYMPKDKRLVIAYDTSEHF